MSTATGPLSCWCAGRRRTGNGRKIQYVWNRSRFGPPRRLFLWGTVQSRRAGRGIRSYGSVTRSVVGTTVSKRTPSLRGYKSCGAAGRCGERTERCQWQKQRSERVAAVKISSVRRKAAWKFWAPQQDHRPLRRVWGWCMGVTDCHSQCAHWLRNDMVFCKRCGGAGRCRHRPLRKRILWCVGEGLCPSHGRGRTPPLRRVTRSAVKRGVEDAAPYDIIPVFSPPPSLFSP